MNLINSKRSVLVVLAAFALGGLLSYLITRPKNAGNGPQAQGNPQARSGPGGGGQTAGGANNRPGAGGGSGPGGGGFPGGAGGGRPQLVEVATVRQGSIREQVSLVGSLKPLERVDVTPKITGRLKTVLVQVGDPVKQGQLIAELEDDELGQQELRFQASLAVTQANHSQREAELENARAERERAANLVEEGLISPQSWDTIQTRYRVVESQLKLAQAQVQQATADLQELRIRKQQTKLMSPMDGYVGRRYLDPGALLNPNAPVVTVLQLSRMVTEVSVPEQYLSRLRVGNSAKISVDALQGQVFEGKVARISPLLDTATRTSAVEIEIANPAAQLKAEMFARIQMDLGTERSVLLVPREAVVLRGQQAGVNVLQDDKVKFHPIQPGLSTDEGVEILDGLELGVTVITRGSQALRDGDAVTVPGADEAGTDPRSRQDAQAPRSGGNRS